MRATDVILAVGWIAFWAYWLVAAIGRKPGRQRWGSAIGARVVIVIVVVGLNRFDVFQRSSYRPWLAGVGLVMFGAGLAVAVWARLHIGRNWGSPMTEKLEPELVTTGPYRWIRNPIYSGLILAMVGTVVAVSVYWLVIVALISGFFIYSALKEERYLATRLPDTYPDYRNATKRLIPFVF